MTDADHMRAWRSAHGADWSFYQYSCPGTRITPAGCWTVPVMLLETNLRRCGLRIGFLIFLN